MAEGAKARFETTLGFEGQILGHGRRAFRFSQGSRTERQVDRGLLFDHRFSGSGGKQSLIDP